MPFDRRNNRGTAFYINQAIRLYITPYY
ncbi:hypothetical protein TSAR_000156 [Trichomalopsis sarcophagae]|uniref:Uncharacterized protein n=1 Tax=Trichomalopsis sarcophagae TaxID=543379 RepID=A0A232FC73_9HYME|nr:hypothetical protein TSAR_000156 [Trichomalopsis sarcophagae]